MRIVICLNDKSVMNAKMYVMNFTQVADGYDVTWTDTAKLAYDFKSFDNPDFDKLLQLFAQDHHIINITHLKIK